jgi:chemotaxis signal transduction protein
MSGANCSLSESALELRRAFDHSFSKTESIDARPLADFLAIRLGNEPYAIRLAHIARLVVRIPITPLRTGVPYLLGLVGLRASTVPVYDLRAILGCSTSVAPEWMVIVAAIPIALAFDAFDGHLRLSPDAIAPRDGNGSSWEHARDVVRAADHLRPIVSVPSVVDQIKNFATARSLTEGAMIHASPLDV